MSNKSYSIWMGDPESGNGGVTPESWNGWEEIKPKLAEITGGDVRVASAFVSACLDCWKSIQFFGGDWLQIGVPHTDLVIEFKEDE